METKIEVDGRSVEIKIDGNIMQIGYEKINLAALHDLIFCADISSFCESIDDLLLKLSELMSFLINEKIEDIPTVPHWDDIYLVTKLSRHLKKMIKSD